MYLSILITFLFATSVLAQESDEIPCKKSWLGAHRKCSWTKTSYFPKRVLKQDSPSCAKHVATYVVEFLNSKDENTPINASLQWMLDNFGNEQKVFNILNELLPNSMICLDERNYPYGAEDQTLPVDRACANMKKLEYKFNACINKPSFTVLTAMLEKGPIKNLFSLD
ncbi:hypothetical protein M3Y95_00816800 [Aphelenchoides besseyi]|nr:hypothetical protein M3Y95_00816800 [Aphelenchoides besseyi]